MIETPVVKGSRRSSPIIHWNSLLTCCKAKFTFFLSGFSFHEYARFIGQQVKGKAISWYPFYHFHPLHGAYLCAKLEAGLEPRTFGTRCLEFALSTLWPVAAVVRRMFKTPVPLGNISRVLLNLIKRLIFVILKDFSSLPVLRQLTVIFFL